MLTEVLFCLVFIILYFANRKPHNLPPGIWGIPFFGTVPSSSVSMTDQVQQLRKKHGDIFSWRIGGRIYIFLCDFKIVKDALSKPEISHRPDIYTLDIFLNYHKQGVINTSGERWVTNRRFFLRHLKDLGMGKTSTETVIQREVESLVEDFAKKTGKPQPLTGTINVAILNVIWGITADRRYEVQNEEMLYFHDVVCGLFKDVKFITRMCDLIPWLPKYIPAFIHRMLGGDDYPARCEQIKKYVGKVIEEHKHDFDPENPRDFIDYYLLEMEAQKHDPKTHFTDIGLLRIVSDIFIAGTETTGSTLRWAIFYVAKHQEIQAKVQEELDVVVGRDVLPSMSHSERLPYLEAFLREVLRCSSITGLSIPHAAAEDTVINGYTIPKGAVVIPSLYSCHTDPKYWEEPEVFNPERFLDKEGKIITKKEGFLPFSIGRRVCPGENLAQMELYLFMSGLLQSFSFTLSEKVDLHLHRNPRDRIVNVPLDFNLIVRKRL